MKLVFMIIGIPAFRVRSLWGGAASV